MRRTRRTVLTCGVLVALAALYGPVQVHAATAGERAALVDVYNATDGPKWTRSNGWLVGDPCAAPWDGVQCSDGSVQYVRHDPSDPRLGRSAYLVYGWCRGRCLDLSKNLLNGTIPSTINGLTALTYV
jgi:hypothetical protein